MMLGCNPLEECDRLALVIAPKMSVTQKWHQMKMLDVVPHVKVIENINIYLHIEIYYLYIINERLHWCFNHILKRFFWYSFFQKKITDRFSHFCSLEINYFSAVSVGIVSLHKDVQKSFMLHTRTESITLLGEKLMMG